MATAQTIQEKTAKYILNVTRLDQIINGPASGPESVVQLDDGISKTLRRVLLEMGAPVNVVQWSSTATYTKGTWVYYNGNTYYARQDVPAGILPGSNGLYWQLVAQGEATIVDVVQQALVLAQEAETRVGEAEQTVSELSQQVADTLATIQTIQGELNGFQTELNQLSEDLAAGGVPDYNPATAYVIGDVVVYEGKMYRAKAATTGNLPTNLAYWDKVGDYATLGQNMGVQARQISDHETRITTNAGAITAESTARTTLAAQLRGNYTGTDPNALTQGLLYNERVARVTADQANASETTGVKTRLDNAEFAISGQSSAITTLNSRVSSVEGVNSSQASAITQLQSDLNGKASASALSALDARVTNTENTNSSQATALTTLNARTSTRANMLKNANLSKGLGDSTTGIWNFNGAIPFYYENVPNWGPVIKWAGAPTSGTAVINSPFFDVVATDYTASADTLFLSSGGNVYIDIIFFDAAGNVTLDSDQNAIGYAHDFDPQELRRYQIAVSAKAPPGSTRAVMRVVFNGFVNATALGARRFKFEQGQLPATAFTDDAQIGADSQAVTSLTTRVTQTETTLSTQASQITQLQTDIAGKASSSAVSALDSRVTQTETTLSTQASAITSLQGDVAGKASVSVTNALDARITQTEGTLSTTVSSVSQLTTTVNGHTGTITSLSQVQADQAGILAQTVSLTMVDGKVSGTINRNNGQTTSFQVLADNFSIVSTGTGARTEYSAGNWRVYDENGVLRVRMGVWAS